MPSTLLWWGKYVLAIELKLPLQPHPPTNPVLTDPGKNPMYNVHMYMFMYYYSCSCTKGNQNTYNIYQQSLPLFLARTALTRGWRDRLPYTLVHSSSPSLLSSTITLTSTACGKWEDTQTHMQRMKLKYQQFHHYCDRAGLISPTHSNTQHANMRTKLPPPSLTPPQLNHRCTQAGLDQCWESMLPWGM